MPQSAKSQIQTYFFDTDFIDNLTQFKWVWIDKEIES